MMKALLGPLSATVARRRAGRRRRCGHRRGHGRAVKHTHRQLERIHGKPDGRRLRNGSAVHAGGDSQKGGRTGGRISPLVCLWPKFLLLVVVAWCCVRRCVPGVVQLLAHYYERDWAEAYGVAPELVRVWVGLEPTSQLLAVFSDALCEAEKATAAVAA